MRLSVLCVLQSSDAPTSDQPHLQTDSSQGEESQTGSSTAAAETPASQDNGWDEQTGWDFQDVPLDSPWSRKQPSTSHKGTADTSSDDAARQQHASQGDGISHERQLATLRQANDALTRRLKHVETVRTSLFTSCSCNRTVDCTTSQCLHEAVLHECRRWLCLPNTMR